MPPALFKSVSRLSQGPAPPPAGAGPEPGLGASVRAGASVRIADSHCQILTDSAAAGRCRCGAWCRP